MKLEKRSRGPAMYKQRNLQLAGPHSGLHVVACVHTMRNVPSIISLLQLSNPTNRSRIYVYPVHLLELTSRTPPMLIVHEPSTKGTLVHSEQVVSAFEKYEQHADGVTVQSLTSVSAYSSMHQDICNIAEDYQATLVVLPFHKMLTVDGEMETINPAIRIVNEAVLKDAPCSVAILVDRGLSQNGKFTEAGRHMPHNVALLFFGGPDDREALTYGCRFAEQPGVVLAVVRFVPSHEGEATSNAMFSANIETRLDNECIREFRLRFASSASVSYVEKVVSDSAETVEAIRSMDILYNLYVVGKASGEDSPLVAGMTEFTEYPELGPIGDLLVSADFGPTVSVLVVQQYTRERRTAGVEAGSRRSKKMFSRDGYSSIRSQTT